MRHLLRSGVSRCNMHAELALATVRLLLDKCTRVSLLQLMNTGYCQPPFSQPFVLGACTGGGATATPMWRASATCRRPARRPAPQSDFELWKLMVTGLSGGVRLCNRHSAGRVNDIVGSSTVSELPQLISVATRGNCGFCTLLASGNVR